MITFLALLSVCKALYTSIIITYSHQHLRFFLTKALGEELPADGADSCLSGLPLLHLDVQQFL